MRGMCAVIAAFVTVLAACAPGGTPTAVPTQVLIPVTETPAPLVPTRTPTPPPPSPPAGLPTATPFNLAALETDAQRQAAQRAITALAETAAIPPTEIYAAAALATRRTQPAITCSPSTASASPRTYEGFRVILTTRATVYEYVTGTGNAVRLCDEYPIRQARGETLVLIDPIAAQLVALAQRHLAAELDLPQRRIRLVDAQVYTWPDTSLGCPAGSQTYETLDINGYRILLSAGETQYIFHADFDRIMPCAARNEVLPE